jgi:hypothetical protein
MKPVRRNGKWRRRGRARVRFGPISRFRLDRAAAYRKPCRLGHGPASHHHPQQREHKVVKLAGEAPNSPVTLLPIVDHERVSTLPEMAGGQSCRLIGSTRLPPTRIREH